MVSVPSSSSIINLPIDFEALGYSCDKYPIAALGAVALYNGDLTDELLAPTYHIGLANRFEFRCKRDFWDKFPDLLSQLTVDPPPASDPLAHDRNATVKFMGLARESERKAFTRIVTDNASFDPRILSHLVETHEQALLDAFPEFSQYATMGPVIFRPPPYSSLYPGVYNGLPVVDVSDEIHGMVKGLRGAKVLIEPEANSDGSNTTDWDRICATFEVPEQTEKREHDHLPHHDAYVIGWRMHVLDLIDRGRLAMRSPDQRSRKRKAVRSEAKAAEQWWVRTGLDTPRPLNDSIGRGGLSVHSPYQRSRVRKRKAVRSEAKAAQWWVRTELDPLWPLDLIGRDGLAMHSLDQSGRKRKGVRSEANAEQWWVRTGIDAA